MISVISGEKTQGLKMACEAATRVFNTPSCNQTA